MVGYSIFFSLNWHWHELYWEAGIAVAAEQTSTRVRQGLDLPRDLAANKSFSFCSVLFAVLVALGGGGQWQLFPSAEGTRTTRLLPASSAIAPGGPLSTLVLVQNFDSCRA
jgi:hypothetical protein